MPEPKVLCRCKYASIVAVIFQKLRIMSDSGSSRENLTQTPPKRKKVKYHTSFDESWLQDPLFSAWLKKRDDFTAECKLCRTDISIKYEGKRALVVHSEGKKHKLLFKNKSSMTSVSSFFVKKHSREEDLITAAEITSVYHGVKHHHSYSSQDCNNKLFPTLFPDSEVAKKIACGRTKATSICENVIAPLSQEILLSELQESTYFALGTDSSNKGNIKMFPVTVQWFSLKDGLKQGLLDFYQDPAETSEAIKTQLCKVLQENGLSWTSVSSLSADNASVNYGIHNSVFQKLKTENPNILKANCVTFYTIVTNMH